MENSTTEYVPQKIFDLQLEDIKFKMNAERERTDDKFEKLQAVIEKNFEKLYGEIKNLNIKVESTVEILDAKIDNLEVKLTEKNQNTNDKISGLEKRFEDMKDYQNKWFVVFGVLLGALTLAFSVIAFFKGQEREKNDK